mgnify:CR=1 FL=1
MAALDHPRRGRGVDSAAERDHEDVRLEGSRTRLHDAGNRIDRQDLAVDEGDARHDRVAVQVGRMLRSVLAEHHVKLGEAEDETRGLVDEGDRRRFAAGLVHQRRQLESSEAGSEDDDAHGQGYNGHAVVGHDPEIIQTSAWIPPFLRYCDAVCGPRSTHASKAAAWPGPAGNPSTVHRTASTISKRVPSRDCRSPR